MVFTFIYNIYISFYLFLNFVQVLSSFESFFKVLIKAVSFATVIDG